MLDRTREWLKRILRPAHPTAEELIAEARRTGARMVILPPGVSFDWPPPPPPVDPGLAAFRAAWPTTRSDEAWSVEAAWDELSEAERHDALAAIPAFLADFDATRRHRLSLVGGATYLEQRRWTLLPVNRRDSRRPPPPASPPAAPPDDDPDGQHPPERPRGPLPRPAGGSV